ncbi:hypothetical protein [Modestobacter italicus]|uniref:hypothetical protein n=1 Tax=Modestobacter italicus (strain DSM 44449 / CECT 9708 / BC 501) TaxID=2732864 RepID=UPI001C96E177|nr:hypothetical protein [Modestobacter italicus]
MIERLGDGASGRERLAPADGEQRVPRWLFVAISLLTLGWLGAGPLLALSAVLGTWDLYGEAPTAAETAAAQRDAVLATVVGAGCPGLAWYLAARWRRGGRAGGVRRRRRRRARRGPARPRRGLTRRPGRPCPG